MADRYAVATGNWNSTATWSTTSGGSPGASVPTLNDNVFLNAASGAITVTVSDIADCKNFDCSGFTGTFAGTFGLTVWGDVVTLSSSMTYSHTSEVAFSFAGAVTLTTNGKTITSSLQLRIAGVSIALNAALTTTSSITVTHGTFTTNNYAVTATSLSSANTNVRTINLGSSTVTLSAVSAVNFSIQSNLTFNAGTSSLVFSNNAGSIVTDAGVTFYNVSWTSTTISTAQVQGNANTFNNLSMAGRTTAGISQLALFSNQTINGTLTLSAGTDATMRTFLRSDTIGTTRTLTCAAVASLTDIDFRDITIAGAAAPVSGTRLGDAKGNSGITFGAGVTRYWNLAAGGNWSATGWAATSGGSPAANNFPLAQDTCLFEATGLNSGATVTINAAYNIGTIDMSARTSNTMTLSCGSTPTIYGNWINGTGLTFTGTGTFTFAGRGSQTLTSAGRTFTQAFTMDNPSGSVTLQDAFVCNRASTTAFNVLQGTIDANSYNFTLSSTTTGVLASNGVLTRAIAIGSGTWTFAAAGNVWNTTGGASLTVTGTGTISLTSTSAKTFTGGSVQTYPILNQGGTGTLTVTGSNKFTNITNSAIGRVQFTGGTTNEFGAFNLNGVLGNLLPLGSTNTTQATLNAPSWNVGIASTDAGNNTGLSFTGLSPNFLSISYINGVITTAPPSGYGNFLVFF